MMNGSAASGFGLLGQTHQAAQWIRGPAGTTISQAPMNTGTSPVTLFIAAGAPYAESALLLGQKLPGASAGYVHPEHLVEHLRPFAQRLEDLVYSKIQMT
jgi:hypothetical protein